jgi:hypothetical protein
MKIQNHPRSDRLEAYVLARMTASDERAVTRIEQHLLICGSCVERAEQVSEFAGLIRSAWTSAEPILAAAGC